MPTRPLGLDRGRKSCGNPEEGLACKFAPHRQSIFRPYVAANFRVNPREYPGQPHRAEYIERESEKYPALSVNLSKPEKNVLERSVL